MKLHQARMKDVCHSIKAHYLWETLETLETLEFPFPDFSDFFWLCGETISPAFDLSRHWGLCKLKEWLADGPSAHEAFYPLEESWV